MTTDFFCRKKNEPMRKLMQSAAGLTARLPKLLLIIAKDFGMPTFGWWFIIKLINYMMKWLSEFWTYLRTILIVTTIGRFRAHGRRIFKPNFCVINSL